MEVAASKKSAENKLANGNRNRTSGGGNNKPRTPHATLAGNANSAPPTKQQTVENPNGAKAIAQGEAEGITEDLVLTGEEKGDGKVTDTLA